MMRPLSTSSSGYGSLAAAVNPSSAYATPSLESAFSQLSFGTSSSLNGSASLPSVLVEESASTQSLEIATDVSSWSNQDNCVIIDDSGVSPSASNKNQRCFGERSSSRRNQKNKASSSFGQFPGFRPT